MSNVTLGTFASVKCYAEKLYCMAFCFICFRSFLLSLARFAKKPSRLFEVMTLRYPGSGYGYGSDHPYPYPYSVTQETNQT